MKRKLLERVASIGAAAQAAIPGLYAWAITVAPAAWSRGAPRIAQVAAILGVLALLSAPFIEGSTKPASGPTPTAKPRTGPDDRSRIAVVVEAIRSASGPTWARVVSVWGFVLSSAFVWAAVPSALSSTKLDGVRGALGMVGWGLFAFASAGPALQQDPELAGRVVASTSLKPRSELPRGDSTYIAAGVLLAIAMQGVGWGVAAPERAVLVRLITVVCGIAVIGGTTSIALARHSRREAASRRTRLRRALPWLVMLALVAGSGAIVGLVR